MFGVCSAALVGIAGGSFLLVVGAGAAGTDVEVDSGGGGRPKSTVIDDMIAVLLAALVGILGGSFFVGAGAAVAAPPAPEVVEALPS